MTFYIGKAARLSAADLTALAAKHGIEERALKAVVQVEAAGKAFHSTGALVCLYEPHIAYRYSSGRIRDALVAAGLAYSKWKRNYPATSYARIDKCTAIAGAEVAALATSWGAPQMMGFNHKVCGYPTAVQMVKAFAASEAAQIEGMIAFIKASPKMWAALKAHDWAGFAERYNGSGYKQNGYDTKLAAAYAKAPAALPIAPGKVIKIEDDTPVTPVKNRLLAFVIDLIVSIFWSERK